MDLVSTEVQFSFTWSVFHALRKAFMRSIQLRRSSQFKVVSTRSGKCLCAPSSFAEVPIPSAAVDVVAKSGGKACHDPGGFASGVYVPLHTICGSGEFLQYTRKCRLLKSTQSKDSLNMSFLTLEFFAPSLLSVGQNTFSHGQYLLIASVSRLKGCFKIFLLFFSSRFLLLKSKIVSLANNK